MRMLESRLSGEPEYYHEQHAHLLEQRQDSSVDIDTNDHQDWLLANALSDRATKESGLFFNKPNRSSRSCALRWVRRVAYFLLYFCAMIGIIESISLLSGIAVSFFSEDFLQIWGGENGLVNWPTDLTRDVLPVPCHSHNDYSRPMPLFSALKAGCIGVEADVWLINEELHVAHTQPKVTQNRTLKSLYIDPLVDLLEEQNLAKRKPLHGVFETDPDQSLILLIDFKTGGADTLPYVISHLSPLRDREYLTYWNGVEVVNGPIIVVATGNAPFDLLTANSTYRDVFYDAPLDLMEDGQTRPLLRARSAQRDEGQGHSGTPNVVGPDTYNPSNSYYASVSYGKSIGVPWHFYITSNQLGRIRAQINGAHQRGLKVRYWGTPSWPRSLRNHVWSVLAREGADILNVDDLQSATKGDWQSQTSKFGF